VEGKEGGGRQVHGGGGGRGGSGGENAYIRLTVARTGLSQSQKSLIVVVVFR
jgi:hypothetical protein